jgi:hypothetical protein
MLSLVSTKNIETALMEYLGAQGTMIHEKNLKSKISCQTPFNVRKIIPIIAR